MNDDKILREYVREILKKSINEEGLFDKAAGLGKALVGMGGKKSGPQKWFADFMQRRLDKTGSAISSYLSKKLDVLLPDTVKKAIEKKQSNVAGDGSSINALAKAIDGWISMPENSNLSEKAKKDATNYAAETYAKLMKSRPDDESKVLSQIVHALNTKYGVKKQKKNKKSK